MKTRIGFVSNSSSASFILKWKTTKDFKQTKIEDAVLNAFGIELTPHLKEQIENFRAMTSFNMDLLFRGHEHTPYILNINRGQNLSGVGVELDEVAKAVTRTTPGFDNPLVLGSDRRHVISVPAFKYRGYAIFDSETSSLEFRKYS